MFQSEHDRLRRDPPGVFPREDRHERRAEQRRSGPHFPRSPDAQRLAGQARGGRTARAGLRPGEDGTNLGQYVPHAHHPREVAGGEGEAEACTRCGQRGQDDEGSRHRHHRYGHPFLREAAQAVSAPNAKSWFKDLPENVLEYIALRNSSLQGAYFMLAARRWGSIAARCRGSTTQRWTRRSSQGRRSNPISFATSVTAMRANSIHAHRASALRRRASWFDGIARSLSTRRGRSWPTWHGQASGTMPHHVAP